MENVINRYAKYPFLKDSAEYVKDHGFNVQTIITNIRYQPVMKYAQARVLKSLNGIEEIGDTSQTNKLLLYPIARILISAIGEEYLKRRFAMYEAKQAFALLKTEDNEILELIAKDFNIKATITDNKFIVSFQTYLLYSYNIRESKWKLINREIKNGKIQLDKDDFARIIEEAIRIRIENFPTLPEGLSDYLSEYISEIKPLLKVETNIIGPVEQTAFPPCMSGLLEDLTKGVNLPHTARFALTSFLANIGMNVEEIIALYRKAPDFKEEFTRYQVEHIVKGEYKTPGCKTMKTFHNCKGECTIPHPLTYYRKKYKPTAPKST